MDVNGEVEPTRLTTEESSGDTKKIQWAVDFEERLAGLPMDFQKYLKNTSLDDISSHEFGTSKMKQKITDNIPVLLDCIDHGLDVKRYETVIRIMDLIYRGNVILADENKLGQILVQLEKITDLKLPTQLIVVKAKYQHDIGDLHGARRQLVVLLELAQKDCVLGEQEKTSVRAVCHQLLGETFNKLCCWKDAVTPLKKGADLFQELLGNKGSTSQCIDLMCRCLTKIQMDEFEELKTHLNFTGCHPCHEAYIQSKRMWMELNDNWPLRHLNNGTEAMLMFVVDLTGDNPCQKLLSLVIEQIKESLTHFKKFSERSGPLLNNFCFEFSKALFTAALALHFSLKTNDRKLSLIFEQKSMVVYGIYNNLHYGHVNADEKIADKILKFQNAALKELGLANDSSKVSRKKNVICTEELHTPLEDTDVAAPCKRMSWCDDDADFKTSDSGYGSCHRKVSLAEPQHVTPRFPSTDNNDNKQNHQGVKLRECSDLWEVGLVVRQESAYGIPVMYVPVDLFQRTLGVKPNTETISTAPHEHGDYYEHILRTSGDDKSYSQTESATSVLVQIPLVDTGLLTREHTLLDQDRLAQECRSLTVESVEDEDPSQRVRVSDAEWKLTNSSVKRARLFKYNPIRGLWFVQRTIAYIGPELQLEEAKKGNCRDAFEVKYLHQDEPTGRYVGKKYRKQKPTTQYMRDVVCQKVARFLVTLFNFKLKNFTPNVQIQYLPVAHLQLLSSDSDSRVVDWINVEPYLEGEFTKLTNNLKYCSKKGKDIATALTHFTYQESNGQLMLVDIQGWLPSCSGGVIYLTDPQFHTDGISQLSSCDHGKRGMDAFWEEVHPQCNNICNLLGLTRSVGNSN